MLSIIVATSIDGVIGKDNKLPWHLPEDLKRFKAITMNHPIIMGRKTFDSIGKPLPGRLNLVLSRDPSLKIEGAHVVSSLDEAFKKVDIQNDEVFIIGGSDVFRVALPMCDRIYLTEIHWEFEGDKTFPGFDRKQFNVIHKEHHEKPMPHDYITYERIKGSQT